MIMPAQVHVGHCDGAGPDVNSGFFALYQRMVFGIVALG